MKKVTLNKSMRIGGRMYRTGDAAPVSRAHGRMLVAIGHAKNFVEKPVAKPTQVTPASVVRTAAPTDPGSTHDHHEAHHEAHQEAKPSTSTRTAPRSSPFARKAPGQKVEK